MHEAILMRARRRIRARERAELDALLSEKDKCEARVEMNQTIDKPDVNQGFKELKQIVNKLTEMVKTLVFEIKRDRENAERDREHQTLPLENSLLRYGRSLPTSRKTDSENNFK